MSDRGRLRDALREVIGRRRSRAQVSGPEVRARAQPVRPDLLGATQARQKGDRTRDVLASLVEVLHHPARLRACEQSPTLRLSIAAQPRLKLLFGIAQRTLQIAPQKPELGESTRHFF